MRATEAGGTASSAPGWAVVTEWYPLEVDAPQVLPGGSPGTMRCFISFEPAFCDDPAWSDLRWRSAQTRRQRHLQSLQELRHRLLQLLGQLGELDADLKAVQK